MNRHSRIVRSLLIGAAIALSIYLLTDGKFLFVPLVFLPGIPALRDRLRRSARHSASPEDEEAPGDPTAQLPQPPASRSDPRWN